MVSGRAQAGNVGACLDSTLRHGNHIFRNQIRQAESCIHGYLKSSQIAIIHSDEIAPGVYGADQKIASRALLLRLVTINYAKLIGEEKTRGSIEPGKLADFAVLTDDFLTAKPETIRDMKALSTWVGGHEVYRAPGFE